jgi:EmrB/QacA subfamily drug resistance transporter
MPSVPTRFAALIPLIVGCGLLMQGLEGTAIATALPAMAQAFGESPIRLNLAISAYMLAVAVFIPASGWAADRLGARNVFCAAMALFVAASMLCGISQTLPELIGARTLQGMAGAMMTPVGRLVLLRATPRSEIVRAMSILTVPAVLGPIVGPPLGGLIVQAASWRWIFFLSAPVGLLGVVASLLFLPDVRAETPKTFDFRGFVLMGAGLASLVFAMGEVGQRHTSAFGPMALAVAGVALLTAYWVHQRRASAPILHLSLLRAPTFGVSMIGGGLWRVPMAATPLLLVLLLQIGFGLSPIQSGLISFAGALGALFMKGAAMPILRSLGFRRVLIGNCVLGALLLVVQGLFRPTTPHAFMFAALFVTGFFRSLQYTSLSSLCYADIPERSLGAASAFASMVQELSQSFGAALAGMVIQMILAATGQTGITAAVASSSLIVVGGLSLLALPQFFSLPPDAGHAIGGRPSGAVEPAASPAE